MFLQTLTTFLLSTVIAISAIAGGVVTTFLITYLLRRYQSRKPILIGGMAIRVERWFGPLQAIIPAASLRFVLPLLEYPSSLLSSIRHLLQLWIIGSIAWILIRTIAVAREMLMSRLDLTAKDNFYARRVSTQLRVFERILAVVVSILAVSVMLMTFTAVREVGLSILASAGVAGLVIGFAAQRSIATVLAGVHIAITQPIRLQDAVVVEKEFGTIEEITLSYVVVKLWDQRRMIVPITHFIEKPFQNWTRTSSELVGAIHIHSDYTLPVQAVREELRRILESTSLWDGRICALQVVDSNEEYIELRALASAEDAPKTWDLRCYVREKLIEFIQNSFPGSLPRSRVEIAHQMQENGQQEVSSTSALITSVT